MLMTWTGPIRIFSLNYRSKIYLEGPRKRRGERKGSRRFYGVWDFMRTLKRRSAYETFVMLVASLAMLTLWKEMYTHFDSTWIDRNGQLRLLHTVTPEAVELYGSSHHLLSRLSPQAHSVPGSEILKLAR